MYLNYLKIKSTLIKYLTLPDLITNFPKNLPNIKTDKNKWQPINQMKNELIQ